MNDKVAAPLEQGSRNEDQNGALRGLVTSLDDRPIAGAVVKLAPASGGVALQETTSNEDGQYSFRGIPSGAFLLTASFPGFARKTFAVHIEAGQSQSIEPIALPLAVVEIEVEATVPVREIAEEELHVQEEQRLLGFAPNFFVSYKWNAAPLTSGQKFSLAWKNVRDPGNLLLVGTVAGVQQATDGFSDYGQGAAGYGRRYGADLGDLVVGTFMGGAVLPSLFHQDPRYFYKGTGSFKSRLWYSLTSAVLCRGDNGKRQFAWAGVLGDLSAGAVSNAYYAPEDRHGAALTLENGFLGVAGDALNGLVQEFFFKQITPKAKKK